MCHIAKAITAWLWGAGLEYVAQQLGGDDRHAATGKNYRRCHHFLTVTYEAMWLVLLGRFAEEKRLRAAVLGDASAGVNRVDLDVGIGVPNQAAGTAAPADTDEGEEDELLRWVRQLASDHKTWRLWVHFLFDLYPPYLAFRTATRTGDYRLSRVALRKLRLFLPLPGKTSTRFYAPLTLRTWRERQMETWT